VRCVETLIPYYYYYYYYYYHYLPLPLPPPPPPLLNDGARRVWVMRRR